MTRDLGLLAHDAIPSSFSDVAMHVLSDVSLSDSSVCYFCAGVDGYVKHIENLSP